MDNVKIEPLTGDVLHITSDERSRNWMLERNAKKISREVQIVSVDNLPAYRKSGVQLPFRRICEGDILIRHPYESNLFLDASNASFEIRFSKYTLISEIAQRLGATHYEIEEAIETVEEREWSAKGDLDYKMVKASMDINNKDDLKRKMGILIEDQYPRTKASSEDATSFAKKYNLWGDSMIRSLIRKCSYEGNPLLHEHLRFDVTKEANSLFDAAFSLNALGGIFNIDASLNKTLSIRETIILNIKFDFE